MKGENTEQQGCARLETRGEQQVNLTGVRLSGDLRGLMFESSVEQRFCNPSNRNVEVVYTFPLPWGAVLMGVDVVLWDKHLTGTVTEKKQAEARYEEAISEGHAAIMLEKNQDHSVSVNLGNLAAGEHCTITLRYAQTLQFEQRGLRLLIPMVIAPRYGDAQKDGGGRHGRQHADGPGPRCPGVGRRWPSGAWPRRRACGGHWHAGQGGRAR